MRRCPLILVLGALALAGCASEDAALLPRYPYLNPLVSPGAQFAALSPPVQNAIRAETGTAEIAEIHKDPGTGRVDVYFVNDAIFPPLHIAPDGSVLGPSGYLIAIGAGSDDTHRITGGAAAVPPRDLPAAVSTTLRQTAPGAEVARITRELWGDRPIFIITFKDETAHPKLYIRSDGTVLTQGAK
jgi:hypothetical protein